MTTARLILRPPAAEDFPAFARMMAHDSTRFIGGPMVPEVAWRSWAAIIGAWTLNGFSMFSVIERETGQWVGRLGPWRPLGWPGDEVGWGLNEHARGRGFATEGSTAAIDWAFETLGWDDVIHTIGPQNLDSQKVAQRLGATNRGPGRMPPPVDAWEVDIWGQTREEWRSRRL